MQNKLVVRGTAELLNIGLKVVSYEADSNKSLFLWTYRQFCKLCCPGILLSIILLINTLYSLGKHKWHPSTNAGLSRSEWVCSPCISNHWHSAQGHFTRMNQSMFLKRPIATSILRKHGTPCNRILNIHLLLHMCHLNNSHQCNAFGVTFSSQQFNHSEFNKKEEKNKKPTTFKCHPYNSLLTKNWYVWSTPLMVQTTYSNDA